MLQIMLNNHLRTCPVLLTFLNRIRRKKFIVIHRIEKKNMRNSVAFGFRSRKNEKKNPTIDLRYWRCATTTRNTPCILTHKRCVPKEKCFIPSGKILNFYEYLFQNEKLHSPYQSQEIKTFFSYKFIIFSAPK